MKTLQSTAAHELATKVHAAIASRKVIEARLFTTCAAEELPHKATLALYSAHSTEDISDTIFRGDDAVVEIDLAAIGFKNINKRFINSLIEALPLKWRYLSRQVQLDFDTVEYDNVSARFKLAHLVAILPVQNSISPLNSTK